MDPVGRGVWTGAQSPFPPGAHVSPLAQGRGPYCILGSELCAQSDGPRLSDVRPLRSLEARDRLDPSRLITAQSVAETLRSVYNTISE